MARPTRASRESGTSLNFFLKLTLGVRGPLETGQTVAQVGMETADDGVRLTPQSFERGPVCLDRGVASPAALRRHTDDEMAHGPPGIDGEAAFGEGPGTGQISRVERQRRQHLVTLGRAGVGGNRGVCSPPDRGGPRPA